MWRKYESVVVNRLETDAANEVGGGDDSLLAVLDQGVCGIPGSRVGEVLLQSDIGAVIAHVSMGDCNRVVPAMTGSGKLRKVRESIWAPNVLYPSAAGIDDLAQAPRSCVVQELVALAIGKGNGGDDFPSGSNSRRGQVRGDRIGSSATWWRVVYELRAQRIRRRVAECGCTPSDGIRSCDSRDRDCISTSPETRGRN